MTAVHARRNARRLNRLGTLFLTTALLGVLVACQTPVDRSQDATPYSEQHRPRFHFSPPAMWMNDPNGMVFHDGEYHLFYQYYPEDTIWGPMHWGHAVSSDLVYWQNLPIALYPDDLGYIFSGSAVVDERNTTGFGTNGEPPLVAIFTYHNPELARAGTRNHEYQGIAWSTDRGRSWTKYSGNPVLPNPGGYQDFRDPKVFWHDDSDQWVMALSATDHVQFWSSDNLKEWRYLSDFGQEWGAHGGVWECPDLVEMPVEGGGSRWVLILNLNPGGPQGGSGTQYFVGDFDGERYTLDASFADDLREAGAVWLDAGRDNYAGVTWSNVPAEDGRTLFIGWMGNWDYAQAVPTEGWRSAMTLPRALTLHQTGSGYRVFSEPVAELKKLRRSTVELEPWTVAASTVTTIDLDFPVSRSEVVLTFELPDGGPWDFGVELRNDLGESYRFGLDGGEGAFYSDRTASGDFTFSDHFSGVHRSKRISTERILRLQLFFDVASVEAFADAGANVLTDTFFPSREFSELRIYAEGRPVVVREGTVHQLAGIWPGSD